MTGVNPLTGFRSGYQSQGSPLGMLSQTVTLTADNTQLTMDGFSLLLLSSNNTTAANRTFSIAPSALIGQRICIVFESGASTTAQLATGTYMKLTATWEPVQYDSIELVSDGTAWIELGRAIATPADTSLADGDILVGDASNLAAAVTMSGDATIDNAGVLTIAAGAIDNAKVDAAAAIDYSKLAAITSGRILVGSAGNVATVVAMSGDATIIASGALTIANNAVTTAKILAANVTLAKLATGITPSHVVKFAANYTTTGGNAAEAITVTGALITDIPFVTMQNDGTNNRTILNAVITADTLTVTFSGDPGNDAIISYQILRAAA